MGSVTEQRRRREQSVNLMKDQQKLSNMNEKRLKNSQMNPKICGSVSKGLTWVSCNPRKRRNRAWDRKTHLKKTVMGNLPNVMSLDSRSSINKRINSEKTHLELSAWWAPGDLGRADTERARQLCTPFPHTWPHASLPPGYARVTVFCKKLVI